MDQIGNYKIVQKLGEGGMGEVFKGVDVMLEREVAIKVLRPELSQREDVLQRFRSEAVALGRLNHANIATVYSFARDGDRYYMALEFVNGEGLDKIITKRGRIPWPDAIRYACGALEGLEHAHRLNVIHRDVKPANILIAYTGAVKIMDFGIARILERARQTRQGYLVGTLEYMSPEQIQGLEVDARSDIYSLGMVLYEMLAGRLPFQKNTEYDLLKSQIEEPPPPLHSFVPDIPQNLEIIVLRALAKKPADRFNSALEFLEALHQMAGDRATGHGPPRETRLAYPGSVSQPGSGGLGRMESSGWRYRLNDFIANYPIPIMSLLALILGAVGFFFLSNKTATDDIRIKEHIQIPRTETKQPEPPGVHERIEETSVRQNTQPPAIETKPVDSIPSPAPAMPAIPPVSMPVESPRLNFPSDARTIEPSTKIREPHKTESAPRKPSPPKVSVKTKSPPAKPKISPAKEVSEPDENEEYWRKLGQQVSSEKNRSKPASRPRQTQQDDNSGYWQNIHRETSGFLKRH